MAAGPSHEQPSSLRSEDSDASLAPPRLSQATSFGSTGSKTNSFRIRQKRLKNAKDLSVPKAVAARLTQFRNKRKEQNANELTLSNLLSVTAVQRAMHLNNIDEASRARERTASNESNAGRNNEGSVSMKRLRSASRNSVGSFDVQTGLNVVRAANSMP